MTYRRSTNTFVGTTNQDSQHKKYIIIIIAFFINSFICLNGIFAITLFCFWSKCGVSAQNRKPHYAKPDCVLFYIFAKHHFIE